MKLRSFILSLLFLITLSLSASAQTNVTPGRTLGWDQPAVNQAEASSFVYKTYTDGSNTGVTLSDVACTAPVAGSPVGTFPCSAPFPAATPGSHSLTATASNAAGESLQSTPFAFIFVVLPNPPRNLRLL